MGRGNAVERIKIVRDSRRRPVSRSILSVVAVYIGIIDRRQRARRLSEKDEMRSRARARRDSASPTTSSLDIHAGCAAPDLFLLLLFPPFRWNP